MDFSPGKMETQTPGIQTIQLLGSDGDHSGKYLQYPPTPAGTWQPKWYLISLLANNIIINRFLDNEKES